ncbi:MAG: Hpt domain-containing protein, partial [Candidatus Micrarchaeota archaeon]
AYKEEAVTYVDALKKLPQLKDNPQNADLISEIHRSAHSLKSMSAAMGFLNISKISKALEILFANYKKGGGFDMSNYDIALGAVDEINTLYSDLANSEKASVEEIVKKVESITPR